MTRVNDRRTASVHALRGAMLTCTGNPFVEGVEATRRYESDAIIVIEGGRIVDVGPARVVAARLPADVRVERMPARTLLVPGFVDCHVHYVQLPVIASHGTQLLDWLERHTFPAEVAMGTGATARATATAFFDETLACGTTTAVCNDNTMSCSQNRSGTCSTHNGVKCWLCPGTLCNGFGAEEELDYTPVPWKSQPAGKR